MHFDAALRIVSDSQCGIKCIVRSFIDVILRKRQYL